MHNIVLTIAYDGSHYLGWQKTKEGPSIEETVQRALEQILQHEVVLQAASRTDTGVHALGQVVNFFTSKESLSGSKLQISLNSLLPKDIVVTFIDERSLSFHPTLSCLEKEYRYYICTDHFQLPQYRYTSWHMYHPLDRVAMEKAVSYFIGKKDFAAFCNAKKRETYSHTIREVKELQWVDLGEKRLCLIIKGDHFLYKMVRNIVGTLVDVGRGKIDLVDLPKIIEGKLRPQAGVTAPAHGLFLYHLSYPNED